MHGDPRQQAQTAGEQLHRFHGGLHLRHNKKISCQTPLRACPIPARLYLPLLQHKGQPAQPVVAVGDQVLAGQLLAQTDKGGASVHASSSGTIESIEDRPMTHPSGMPGQVITLRTDGRDAWAEPSTPPDWQLSDPQTLRETIRAAGIVGLGGAVFPTADKADSGHESSVHTLILNGAECEPYISCDEMLMREQPGKIIEGARILQKAIGAKRTVIAIEDQMGAVRSALLDAVREQQCPDMTVKRIPTVYPEGGERQLIQVLTGLEVPDGGLPQALGLLVQNVATAAAVSDAFNKGTPLVKRIVTVTGNGVKHPANLAARLGTPVSELVEACGGYAGDVQRLVIGGPMMGYALESDAEPVIKNTNCVLVLTDDDVRPPQGEMPCIRCGECARVCPATLLPQELHFRLTAGKLEEAQDWGLGACIECGCCDFVCPSHIPLVDWFRYGKDAHRQLLSERQFSDHSRQRFEARELRLEEQKAARAGRMAARKAKLKNEAERKKQIAAAIARAGVQATNDPEDNNGEDDS